MRESTTFNDDTTSPYTNRLDPKNNEIVVALQEDFQNLIQCSNSSIDNDDDLVTLMKDPSIALTLNSIATTLQQCHEQQHSNDKDKNHSNKNHEFIRSNLTTPSSDTMLDNVVTLRSILESKVVISQLLHVLTQIMTFNNPDDHDNDLECTSLQACHVYLLISVLPGSWSAGWIDMVAMRYVETILRKWNTFCCQYKMKLSDDDKDDDAKVSSRVKRSRLNEEQDDESCTSYPDTVNNEEEVYAKIQYGIDLSKALGNILLTVKKSKFWNWNEEARDALFNSIILAVSTCSALLSHMDTSIKELEQHCQDTVLELGHALEYTITSSVERFDTQSPFEGRYDEDDSFSSPGQDIQYDENSTSSSKSTTIILLRNMYPLLTYQTNLPNGVKGKQAAFEQCQSIIANVVRRLSNMLKSTSRNTITPSKKVMLQTPSTKENQNNAEADMITPTNRRKTLTPKSTNRKRLVQSKDGLKNLIVPPSLKKSVTPKGTSLRKSLLVQQSASTNATKSVQRRKEEIKECRVKEILDIFIAMIQKLSATQMERVEVRARISGFISCLLENMKDMHRFAFTQFIIRLCSSKMSSHRMFGVEMLCSIFSMNWVWNDSNEHVHSVESNRDSSVETPSTEFPLNQSVSFLSLERGMKNHLSKDILSALYGRIMDKSPAVRARVAIALSTSLNDMKIIFEEQGSETQDMFMECMEHIGLDLLSSLRQRAKSDEKASVRKAALLAFVDLLLICDDGSSSEVVNKSFNLTLNDIHVLCQLCNDQSVVVRKAAVDAILLFMERQHQHTIEDLKYDFGSLEVAWVNFVLPLVRDVEPSCVSKVVASFESLIIAPILENKDLSNSLDGNLIEQQSISTWRILSLLNNDSSSTGSSSGLKNALNIAMRKLFEEHDNRQRMSAFVALLGELHGIIADAISDKNHDIIDVVKDRVVGAWCLLESIGSINPNKKTSRLIDLEKAIEKSGVTTEFLVDSCNYLLMKCCEKGSEESLKSLVVSTKSFLHVVASFAHVMETKQIKSLAFTLKEATKSFNLVLDLIGPSANALVALVVALCKGKPHDSIISTCTDWIKEILYKCEAALNLFVSSETSSVSVTTLCRVIFTAGEMSLIGFKQGQDSDDKLSHKDNSIDPIQGLNVRPTDRLIRLIQSLLPHTLPSMNGAVGKVVDPVLRAQAFVAFGKLCLRDQKLAKESLNIFAQELHEIGPDSNAAVRSNALLVLGDLCVCYTHLVDKFLPLMATCLQAQTEDNEENTSIVCQHAIILFSNLLLQDYIKWKGLLFYRFVAAAVSKDAVVANLAKAVLCGPLLSKQPQLFSNNFIDTIFILNGCKSRPMNSSSAFGASNEDRLDELGSLRVKSALERSKIYDLLLDHMSDEEKIGVTARLAKDVLQSATGRSGSLSQAASAHSGVQEDQNLSLYGAYCVLSDCFSILTNSRLHIGKSKQNDQLEEEEDANASLASLGPNAAQLHSVKGRLLSKISRKHMIETVVPILCNLKLVLEKSRSPLLKQLMGYMVCIFRQFKSEINELLVSNKTLLQEIQYDTRQFEKSQIVETSAMVEMSTA